MGKTEEHGRFVVAQAGGYLARVGLLGRRGRALRRWRDGSSSRLYDYRCLHEFNWKVGKNLLKIPWIHGPMWIVADGPYTIGPANLPWPTS